MIAVLEIEKIAPFLRKSFLKDVYYKVDYSSIQDKNILSQLYFLNGGKDIITKLCKKNMIEVPDYAEIYFNEQMNSVLESNGITFYIDELSIDNSTEIERLKKIKESILAKLKNPDFVNKAPAKTVELERKKLQDTETKLKTLEVTT